MAKRPLLRSANTSACQLVNSYTLQRRGFAPKVHNNFPKAAQHPKPHFTLKSQLSSLSPLIVPSDSANLNNLQDIVLPTPPSFWPPAQGLWILVALITMLVITATWMMLRMRQRNAYRRAGLILLAQASTLYEINVVLKRVALAVFPREQVAHLHGKEWTQFMQSTCLGNQFETFGLVNDDSPANDAMRNSARTWICHHQSNTN